MRPLFLALPYGRPMDWPVALLLLALGLLLVGSLAFYLVSALRNRGKPKPDRLGNGNFLGANPGGGRGPAAGGPAGGAPAAFALPPKPKRPDADHEPDPRRR
ncbi:MAG: hypothetical protein ACOX83_08225 [Candidatus Spyradocola sp.]|jgi:hypothetical protein